MQEKAYKLLAAQENISHNEAKALIDAGLVSARGAKIALAREMLGENTKFSVMKPAKPAIIYEDENVLAVNKPPFMSSENLEKIYKFRLLNRLDKETSGVVLLYKNEEFREAAIAEFKNLRVKKSYIAIVKGIVSEEMKFDEPILTIRTRSGAFSKISPNGKSAFSEVYPLMISGKKSLVKVRIETGRTHQIRVHLSSINRHILGDHLYGFKSENAKISRILLHAYLLYFIHPRSGKEVKVCAGLPSEFLNFTTNQKVKDEIYEKILPTNVERYFSDTSGWLRYV